MDTDQKMSLLCDLYTDIVNTHGVGSFQAEAFRDRHGNVPGFIRKADTIDQLKRDLTAGGTGPAT